MCGPRFKDREKGIKKMVDFSKIASGYESKSLVQKSAGQALMNLLHIQENDDVLDLGCGVGNLTSKIREITNGQVVGIDPSEEMINMAMSKKLAIAFDVRNAETMDYNECFDVIFCNSAFQWFKNPHRSLKNCIKALRENGRMGIQSPAKKIYSPNFIDAIEKVIQDPDTKDIFKHFKPPWIIFETEGEYSALFERAGFRIAFSKIETIRADYSPDEVFAVFCSGAIAGYLNQDFYDIYFPENYPNRFKDIIKDAFRNQANKKGMVKLIFNRIYLVAVKR